MIRPRFYRDPIHLQIRYERTQGERFGHIMQRLIDLAEFQRLRHIRQNGLTNLVFYGAEHSRFVHSMGVAYLAREMYDRICLNSGSQPDDDVRLATSVAALLHDIGHGPFSHTLEEILRALEVNFDHEHMTRRIIQESEVRCVLDDIDPELTKRIVAYIDKKSRGEEHWSHKIVSSQLDADRLDYLLRDAASSGLRGHTFDLPRLLDMLYQVDDTYIAVHRRGLETVEGYLIALDQVYRAVYYHHTVRAASQLLSSVLSRAATLYRGGDSDVLEKGHPLGDLLERGNRSELEGYLRLGEFHLWTLIESWRGHTDKVLADLTRRLFERRLFKTMEIQAEATFNRRQEVVDHAKKLAMDSIPHVDQETASLYVCVDEPSRTSYKRYDWTSETTDESIWIIDDNEEKYPLLEHPNARVNPALKTTFYFSRLVFPEEILTKLSEHVKGRVIK